MNNNLFSDLTNALVDLSDAATPDVRHGALGWDDDDGFQLLVSGASAYCYVTMNDGGVIKALYKGVSLIANLPVLVEFKKGQPPCVIGPDHIATPEFMGEDVPLPTVGVHSHRFKFGNVDFVEGLRFDPGLVYPEVSLGGVSMRVNPCVYEYLGVVKVFPGGVIDLTDYVTVTADKHAGVIVGIDVTTNELTAATGDDYDPDVALNPEVALATAFPDGKPLCMVDLSEGQTTAPAFPDDFIDLRNFVGGVFGDFRSDGTIPMSGDLDMDGNDIQMGDGSLLDVGFLKFKQMIATEVVSEAITVTQSTHSLTYAGLGVPDLKTINAEDGTLVILYTDVYPVTVKHAAVGGNIVSMTGADLYVAGGKFWFGLRVGALVYQIGGEGAGGGGSSFWQQASGVVALQTATDHVTIGSTTDLGKFAVDGLADEVQMVVQANGTQTSDLVQVQRSDGTVFARVQGDGTLVLNDDGSAASDVRIEGDTNANLLFLDASADSLGIGTATPDASAILDLVSTVKGFGLPNMTTTQRDAISSPRDGLVIYNSTTNKLNLRASSAWGEVAGSNVHTFAFAVAGGLTATGKTLRLYNRLGSTATITEVFVSVGTAPVGAAILIDVNKNGTTIFTNQAHRPSISAGSNTASDTGIDVSSLANGDYLTIDIDQVGSTTTGSDLTVHVTVTY